MGERRYSKFYNKAKRGNAPRMREWLTRALLALGVAALVINRDEPNLAALGSIFLGGMAIFLIARLWLPENQSRRPAARAPTPAKRAPIVHPHVPRADISKLPAKAVHLQRVHVLDGDTIDDWNSRIRYRLVNIDAPETGDYAVCRSERYIGERAKREVIMLTRAAAHVEARPTGKIDRFGRTVAYILVDGVDLGEILISRGLARRWNGQPATWCGKDGQLLDLATACGRPWHCYTCGQKTNAP